MKQSAPSCEAADRRQFAPTPARLAAVPPPLSLPGGAWCPASPSRTRSPTFIAWCAGPGVLECAISVRPHEAACSTPPPRRPPISPPSACLPNPAVAPLAPPPLPPRQFNARSETVAESPAFKRLVSSRRCLVLVEGFFEWAAEKLGKQPYYVHLQKGPAAAAAAEGAEGGAGGSSQAASAGGSQAGGSGSQAASGSQAGAEEEEEPLVLAGLWDVWHGAEGAMHTYTILTTGARLCCCRCCARVWRHVPDCRRPRSLGTLPNCRRLPPPALAA